MAHRTQRLQLENGNQNQPSLSHEEHTVEVRASVISRREFPGISGQPRRRARDPHAQQVPLEEMLTEARSGRRPRASSSRLFRISKLSSVGLRSPRWINRFSVDPSAGCNSLLVRMLFIRRTRIPSAPRTRSVSLRVEHTELGRATATVTARFTVSLGHHESPWRKIATRRRERRRSIRRYSEDNRGNAANKTAVATR